MPGWHRLNYFWECLIGLDWSISKSAWLDWIDVLLRVPDWPGLKYFWECLVGLDWSISESACLAWYVISVGDLSLWSEVLRYLLMWMGCPDNWQLHYMAFIHTQHSKYMYTCELITSYTHTHSKYIYDINLWAYNQGFMFYIHIFLNFFIIFFVAVRPFCAP